MFSRSIINIKATSLSSHAYLLLKLQMLRTSVGNYKWEGMGEGHESFRNGDSFSASAFSL